MGILFTVLIQAQEPITEKQLAVQHTVMKVFDALSNRDSVNLKNYCTPDILLFEYGMVWNIDTLIMKGITLNQATDFKRTNTISFIHTEVNKNTAWATYNLNSEITRNGKQGFVKWMETVVLIRKKKRWKIDVLHSTLISRN
ncbi:MAG: hypothetical protein JWM28_3916 [Chitinophagaceae bacterium]|nr:hypothetical protein [Chitinophagaceae bacterium]